MKRMGEGSHTVPLRMAYVLFLWLCASLLVAEESFPSSLLRSELYHPVWYSQSFAKDAGIENLVVFDIDFEQDGTAWLATSIGLLSYNGYTWKLFTTEHGLPSNFIRSVCVTQQGELWVGSIEGAGVFDGTRYDSRNSETGLAGPCIKRIVEDHQGTLWFCCDRWPKASASGGLSKYENGVWTNLNQDENFPSDHPVDVYHATDGTIFVTTNKGVWQKKNGVWINPIDNTYFNQYEHFRRITYTNEHGYLISSDFGIYQFKNESWNFYPLTSFVEGSNLPLLTTRNHGILSYLPVKKDSFQLLSWKNNTLEPVSPLFYNEAFKWISTMREAPDGSIWCVGEGVINRLYQHQGEWITFANIPPPSFMDNNGCVWFIGESAFIQAHEDGWTAWIDYEGEPFLSADRTVWNWNQNTISYWEHEAFQQIPPETTHLFHIAGKGENPERGLCCYGKNQTGEFTFSLYLDSKWLPIPCPVLHDKNVLMAYLDPQSNIWVLSSQSNQDPPFQLFCINTQSKRIREIPVPPDPDIGVPKIFIGNNQRIWYFNQGIYYMSTLDEKVSNPEWKAETNTIGNTITTIFEGANSTWFLCSGSSGGKWGVSRQTGKKWEHFNKQMYYGQALYSGDILFADLHNLHFFSTSSPTAYSASLPRSGFLGPLIQGNNQTLWVGIEENVYHYKHDSIPPLVRAHTMQHSLQVGEPLSIQCQTLEYMQPISDKFYAYSWKLNGSEWTEFQYIENNLLHINTENLSPGVLTLQIRSRDEGLDISENIETVHVRIAAIPIQQRWWFVPVLLITILLISFLALTALMARKKIGNYAKDLEKLVSDRTNSLQHSEKNLLKSNLILQNILDTIPVRVFWKDKNLKYIGCNQHFAKDIGLASPQEVMGRDDILNSKSKYSLQYRQDDLYVLQTKQAKLNYEEQQVAPDGTEATLRTSKIPLLDANGEVYGILGVYEDISEQKKLEELLRQSQKMEAIGKLAGGIAHDFNNILTGIIGYSELLLTKDHLPTPSREKIQHIRKAADRAAALTRQLLAFSRKQILAPKIINLNDLIMDLHNMLTRLIGEDIHLIHDLDPNLNLISIDPNQMEQIIINLVVNSRDAMPTGGKLTIETANTSLDQQYHKTHPDVPPGDYVMLAISDSGTGIRDEIKEKIFEPFFTTKDRDKGTGLGLSTVFGIVKQSGGNILVYSEKDLGTTFKIYFPHCQEKPYPAQKSTQPRREIQGRGTILIVEDDNTVRDYLYQILSSSGYTALACESGEEGLDVFIHYNHRFDLLITDVVLPKMSGREISARLTELKPELLTLFISGYTDNVIVHHGVLDRGVNFIQKPFTSDKLLAKVQDIFNGK